MVNLKNGQTLSGVVVNLNGDRVTLNTDLYGEIKELASKERKLKVWVHLLFRPCPLVY